jgi:hypothetical protein
MQFSTFLEFLGRPFLGQKSVGQQPSEAERRRG